MRYIDSIPRRVGKKPPTVHKGEIYEMSRGSKLVILDYFDSQNVLVKFMDDYSHEKLASAGDIRKGKVKNPYEKSAYGIGFLGAGEYGIGQAYYMWKAMFNRCYDPKMHMKEGSYVDCSVNPVWHNFQNYAEWFYTNKYFNPGWHLDKDLIELGNRVYGPDVCAFVPTELNMVLVQCRDNTELGVTWNDERQKWCAKISRGGKVHNLGRFTDRNEALVTYKFAKESHVKSLAEKWKGQIDERVYNSLMNICINPGVTV